MKKPAAWRPWWGRTCRDRREKESHVDPWPIFQVDRGLAEDSGVRKAVSICPRLAGHLMVSLASLNLRVLMELKGAGKD